MNDLSKVETHELVNELKKREGVEVTVTEPYENETRLIEGPATVLVVVD